MGKSEGLTREQHDLCYEIQFAIMRGIVNLDHEKMWELIQKAIEGKEPKGGKTHFREEKE